MIASWNRFLLSWVMLMLCMNTLQQTMAGQVQMPVRIHSGDLKSSLNRILELHLENSDEIIRSSSSLKSLERTLTALQPTLIMVSFQATKETSVSALQVALFLEIQKKVFVANSRCKFSVTLPLNNLTTPELLAKLQDITTKLGPDIINMVVPLNNDLVSPRGLAKGIDFAHAHGQLVTYEGPTNMIPDRVDGFIMKAVNGEIRRDEVNNFKTKHHLPVIVRFSSGLHNQDQKEIMLLSHLAEEQAPFGYHLAYPLQLSSSGQLDENKDGVSLVMLRALMTRYN